MKRTLISALAAALFLIGCSAKPAQSVQTQPQTHPSAPTQTEATVPSAPVVQIRQAPLYAVSLPVVTEQITNDDGKLIFTHTSQSMSLTLPEAEVAHKIILDFYNRTDSEKTVEELKAQVRKDLSDNPQTPLPFSFSTVFSAERIDGSILSIKGYESSYSGGVHPETIDKAVTYDLLTGDALNCSAVLEETATTQTLLPLIYDALKTQSDSLYEGYETMVKEKFSQGVDRNPDWYFSGSGLCFFFSPYEIGPFASGTIVAEIPYNQLTGILRDQYFPAERDTAAGKVQTIPYDTADLTGYNQFAEVILRSGGKKMLLVTDSSVQDVRITWRKVDDLAYGYTHNFQVFAAYGLTPGDAIVVESDEPLTVTYTTKNEQITEEFTP